MTNNNHSAVEKNNFISTVRCVEKYTMLLSTSFMITLKLKLTFFYITKNIIHYYFLNI